MVFYLLGTRAARFQRKFAEYFTLNLLFWNSNASKNHLVFAVIPAKAGIQMY